MIVYKQGDILLSDANIIAHGVNCEGGFGSGIAKQIAQRYPVVREQYVAKHNAGGWTLGEIQKVYYSEPPMRAVTRIVVNCATQQRYGKTDLGPYVSYPAIRTVFKNLMLEFPHDIVSVPKIGAGLAGGNWDIIEKIINEESVSREVHVYIL